MKTPYCESGVCELWEYCCSDNECCIERDIDTLLLIAIILGTLLILAPCCCCLYYKSRRIRAQIVLLKKYMGINYTRMGNESTESVNSAGGDITASANCTIEIDKTKSYT